MLKKIAALLLVPVLLAGCSAAGDVETLLRAPQLSGESAALQKALRSLSPRPTVISVSQRVSTVRRCDMIVVMDEGEVVGRGSHEELLRSCPTYQEICASQMRKEEAEA